MRTSTCGRAKGTASTLASRLTRTITILISRIIRFVFSLAYLYTNLYAFDTGPGGLVSKVSDTTLGPPTFGAGFISSYLVDGPNSLIYFTVGPDLYVMPITGGDGSATHVVTLPDD